MYTISYNLNCNPGRWSKQMSLFLLHRPENKQKPDLESETLRSNSNSFICILWPGSYYLTSLSLSFLISKMGTWYYQDFYLKYLAHHLEHGECVCMCMHTRMHAQSLSCVRLFVTPRNVDQQAPLSVEFSRQGYWSRFPFPSTGDLPNPGIKPTAPMAPALTGRFFTTVPPGKSLWNLVGVNKYEFILYGQMTKIRLIWHALM